MPKEFSRMQRIEGLLIRKLSEYIRCELNDPRVALISISEIKVSKDVSHAKVFCTSLEGAEETVEAIKVLNKAGGCLRSLLAKSLPLKKVPILRFVYDETNEKGAYLNKLIDSALKDIDG